MIQKRLLTCLLIDLNKRKITIFCSVGRVYLINTTRLKKKKIGACVFWAPYFSKSFGGKTRHIWTDVTYRIYVSRVLLAPISF